MDLGYSIIRPFLLVHCVGVVLSASYYQREYSGYLFTIPGFNDQRSQNAAQTWCNQTGSKLLTITSQSIQSAAVAFINEAVGQGKMTTGNPIITDGQRIGVDWTWVNETAMTPLAIGKQEGVPSTTYAYLYVPPSSSSLSLYADIPSNKKYFICEGQMFCGYGYQYQNQCYQSFRSDEKSWFDARNVCLQRGGDLATFEFIKANDGLNMLNNGSWLKPSTHYWIGLKRERWTWYSSGSDVTYSQWSGDHPIYDVNRQCLCLWPSDWKWSECECNQRFQFVCISSPDVTTTSQSTVSSTFSSTASPSSASIDSTTSPSPSAIQDSSRNDGKASPALAIGLGVGLGLLFVVIVIIVVLILLSRKGCISFKRQRAIAKESPTHSDVTTLEPMAAIYVDVVRNGEKGTKDLESEEKNANDEQIQYAEFQIINNKTPQTELDFKNNVSISSSKRMTIVPPNSAKLSEDNDAVEYGEVMKTNRPPFE